MVTLQDVPTEIMPQSVVWSIYGALLVASVIALPRTILARRQKEKERLSAAKDAFWNMMNDVLTRSRIRNQNNPFADLEQRYVRAYNAYCSCLRGAAKNRLRHAWDVFHYEADTLVDLGAFNSQANEHAYQRAVKYLEALLDCAK